MADERQWVTFDEMLYPADSKRITRVWEVQGSGGPGDLIGHVQWSPTWRQYVFKSLRADYNPACLRQIADFVAEQTETHRHNRKERRAGTLPSA